MHVLQQKLREHKNGGKIEFQDPSAYGIYYDFNFVSRIRPTTQWGTHQRVGIAVGHKIQP